LARCGDAASSSTATAASVILCVVTAILVALLSSTYTLADGGSDAYKMRCAACHGANGAGQTMIGRNLKLRSLTSLEVQNQSDEQLEAIIRQGRNKMPSFDRKLSKEQIAAVVKYIRLLKN
jgi:mono/diheme cytochrome c family protein